MCIFTSKRCTLLACFLEILNNIIVYFWNGKNGQEALHLSIKSFKGYLLIIWELILLRGKKANFHDAHHFPLKWLNNPLLKFAHFPSTLLFCYQISLCTLSVLSRKLLRIALYFKLPSWDRFEMPSSFADWAWLFLIFDHPVWNFCRTRLPSTSKSKTSLGFKKKTFRFQDAISLPNNLSLGDHNCAYLDRNLLLGKWETWVTMKVPCLHKYRVVTHFWGG